MDKERVKLFNLFIALTGITLLVTLFVLTAFDVIDIRIPEQDTLSDYVEVSLKTIMLFINIFFMIKCCVRLNNFKCTIQSLVIVCAIGLIYNHIDATTSTFLVAPLIIILVNKNRKKLLTKLLLYILITSLYQYVSGFVKIGLFNLEYRGVNALGGLVYSLDLYIFYYIYWKGVDNYVGYAIKSIFSTKKNSIRQDVKSSEEVLGGEEKLTTKQKVIFATMVMGYQVFQLLVVLTIGLFNQMFFELIILLIVFWIGREILKNCYHCETLRNCSLLTFSGFYIVTKISPPLSVSIFLIVILSGLFVYMLCYIGYKDNRLNMLEIRYENDYTRYGLTKNMADFAYDYLQNKLSVKQQMEKTGLSEQVVKNYRTKINKTIKNHK